MAQVLLYRIPEIDLSYDNVIFFENKVAQTTWMSHRIVAQYDAKISVEPSRMTLTLSRPYSEIENMQVDYCSLVDQAGKTLYYFVTDYEYKTSNATTLILELDVFQTYYYDCEFLDSFVERCHVDRWEPNAVGDLIPTRNYLDEGLQFGDYKLVEDRQSHKKFEDKFLISSTTPLGRNDWNRPQSGGQGGGDFPSGDCWQQGYMSALGFRFVKGYEAFAPKAYKDAKGYWTIAYGVTQHGEPKIYAELFAKQPLKEEEAAKVTYELKKKNYGDKILPTCKELGITKQYQFDALCSFSFNLGYGIITDRKSKIYKAIKADINNEKAIREAFTAYSEPNNPAVHEGLLARRNDECDMFFGRYPKVRPIPIWGSNNQAAGTVTDNDGDGWLPSNCGGGTIPSDMKVYSAYGMTLVYPLQGGRSRITSKLGWRKHPIHGTMKFHNGDDIGCPLNEPVYAAHDGVVIKADGSDAKGYGNWIILESKKLGIQTYYAHNNSLLVSVGQTVKAGHMIAKAGTTGGSTGVHLHYELRIGEPYDNSKVVDPLPHMKTGAIL